MDSSCVLTYREGGHQSQVQGSAVRDGTAQSGTTLPSPGRHCPVRDGTAQSGTALPSPGRHCPVQVGTALTSAIRTPGGVVRGVKSGAEEAN